MGEKKQLSLFSRIAFFANNIAAILLLLSYISIYISPDQLWVFAFLGISYPFLLIINIFFVLFWLFQLKKQLLLSLLVILIGFSSFQKTFKFSSSKDLNKTENQLKILSYNVRLFNVYKYQRKDPKRFDDRNKIFDFLKDENADIMCFQEFFYDKSGYFKTVDTITDFVDATYYHTAYTSENKAHYYFSGAATFSKYPIIERGKVNFEKKSNNICIFTDIVKGKDTLRIYNIHLESISLSKEDEMFYEEISNQDEQDKLKSGTRKILSKLKQAFIKRASQSRDLAKHIKNSPYPVVVCGDFNDTPISYAYHKVSESLNDAFVECGKGIGNTYNGKFPSFRIDYILFTDDFSAQQFNVQKIDYSDHFPIISHLQLNEEK